MHLECCLLSQNLPCSRRCIILFPAIPPRSLAQRQGLTSRRLPFRRVLERRSCPFIPAVMLPCLENAFAGIRLPPGWYIQVGPEGDTEPVPAFRLYILGQCEPTNVV